MRTTITPTKAQWLLEANTINRRVNQSAVAFLAKEILNGDFAYNGESIIVATDGTLLDGQHRLMACVQANKNIEVEFVDGVPITVMPTIDTGSARTSGNVFEISGIRNSASLSAGVKNIMDKNGKKRVRTSSSTGSYVKLSNTEILRFYNNHIEILNKISEFAHHLYNTGTKIITGAKIISFTYLFLYESDTRTVVDFFREVMYGITLRESNYAQLLRTKLINDKISQVRISDNNKTDFIIRAFRGYKNGEIKKKLYTTNESSDFFESNVEREPNIDFDYLINHS